MENGAGYCTHLGTADVIPQLLDRIQLQCDEFRSHSNAGEPCDSACYECLSDYRNQPYHPLLDWRLATDLAGIALGGGVDFSTHDRDATMLSHKFALSFPGWIAKAIQGVPAVVDDTGQQAFLVVHPLEQTHPSYCSERLTEAIMELEDEGYERQSDDTSPARILTMQTSFDLYRRPGFIESRLRAMS